MNEFEFIADCLVALAGEQALALKDDVAIWSPPQGQDAVLSMDTIVESVHFPANTFDTKLAQKLIGVNVSDIIAKGADPLGYFLSLTLPHNISDDQLRHFSVGLKQAQTLYGLKLWGGDTTRTNGGAALTATIIGSCPSGTAVLRSGAKIGDVICVTGCIGDGYLGLKAVMGHLDQNRYDTKFWKAAYHTPNPPFSQRGAVRQYARAALDISDGLIADAQHLATASKIGIRIDLADIPLSKPTKIWLETQPDQTKAKLALASGGDDYQILMSMPITNFYAAQAKGMDITKIGKVTDGSGVQCFDDEGNLVPVETAGYTHF